MKLSLSLLLAATVSSPALAAGQLPKSAAPLAYDISIAPDAKALTFQGTESVQVEVRESTKAIVLNAAELDISAATFDGAKAAFTLDPDKQQLTVALPTAASVGKHVLTFAWKGKINSSAAGMFFIDYTNTDGSKARMLATQFEAADARRFAPVWDEPGFKAKFTLSTIAPAGQTAFSNMPAASVTKRVDGSQLYTFGQSPLMSSYLMFLGMGDVERKTVMSGNTEIGIISRKGVSQQGDFALQSAQKLLAYYNDYFGQPYPLPKLDMIAAPGSSTFFGAMENWGAIFYFENEVLFDPARATESNRQRIYTVVAHEMAHQWFGDLVTPAWWDDLWLNEGFASWMENKATTVLKPEWQAKETAVSDDREAALGIDATAATHPVIRPVETVDQLGEAFDSITYQKGQAVITMLESTLGPDVFRDGVRRYEAKYKYGNTVTDQLWDELGAAAGKPVAQIAHDFTLQGGVPLITLTGATCSGGVTTATLTQGRFGLDAKSKEPHSWHVPMTLGVIGGAVTSTIVYGAVPSKVTVQGCGTLVLNRDKGSYQRSKYDDVGHAAIVRDFSSLALADQLGTLGDDYALALSGDQPFARYLAVQRAVPIDASPIDWQVITSKLASLSTLYRGTPIEAPLNARVVTLLSPVLKRVGFAAQPGESAAVTNLREGLIGRLGMAGDPEVASKARAYVKALATNPTAIPPTIRQPILATYSAFATSAEWDALLAITKAEKSPVARNSYVSLLGTAKDEVLAKRALALIEGNEITAPQKAVLLIMISRRHPELAFDFAVAHLELVNSFLETSSRAGYVVGLAAPSNDPAMPAKVTAFADKNLPEASRGGVTKTLAAIAVRKESANRLRGDVAAWVK